jgi:hypothetical protein
LQRPRLSIRLHTLQRQPRKTRLRTSGPWHA